MSDIKRHFFEKPLGNWNYDDGEEAARAGADAVRGLRLTDDQSKKVFDLINELCSQARRAGYESGCADTQYQDDC